MIKEFSTHLDIKSINSYTPFSPITDRSIWDNINTDIKNSIILIANEHLKTSFDVIPASLWLDFTRTGNRQNFQKQCFLRREALNYLLMAEVIENRNKYIDKIIDLTWMILEETSWIIPAHNVISGQSDYSDVLPDVDNPIIDLMSAEIGVTLSLVVYFLKDKLDAISPLICQRIHREINIRLITPYINRTDYWWMGFLQIGNEKLNNWNPWINSNMLVTILLSEKDEMRKIKAIQKLMCSLNEYLEQYANDGCCDEGPAYWKQASASAFECLEIIEIITSSTIDVFSNNKIKNMGKYILRAYIDNNYVINYADSSAKGMFSPSLIYRYGIAINDNNLINFASYLLSKNKNDLGVPSWGIYRKLNLLINYNQILDSEKQFIPCSEHFFEDVQVYMKRGKEIYLTAKGGNNNENHNHNDVGHFMIFKNGLPLIIDIGNMVYSQKTFSSRRYEIWVNQSIYHNTITVDDVMQKNGNKFKATNVKYITNNEFSEFSLNIEKAYDNSNIKYWNRTFNFNNITEEINISDELHLNIISKNVLYTFMTLCEPIIENNSIIFNNNNEKLHLTFDKDININIEKIILEDTKHIKVWGKKIYRVLVTLKNKHLKDLIKLSFKNIN